MKEGWREREGGRERKREREREGGREEERVREGGRSSLSLPLFQRTPLLWN